MKDTPPQLDPIFARAFPSRPGKGELRRQRVLEAAIGVLAREGLAALSHESVGRAIRMRRSHVAYYFPTVSAIVESCVTYISATAQGVAVEAIAAAPTPAEKLVAYVQANFLWAKAYPTHAAFMMHFYSLCTHDERYREMHRRVRETGRARTLALLGALAPAGRDEAALTTAAEIIQSVITSNLVELLTGGRAEPLERARERTVAQALAVAASVGRLQRLVDQPAKRRAKLVRRR